MDVGIPMGKLLAGDFFPNVVIHITLFIYGKMVGWGTWDPRRVLGLLRLVGSRVVLT